MTWTLYRYDCNALYTFGVLVDAYHEYLCDTLERPWLNNQHNISCIPEGEYKVQRHLSAKRNEECILIPYVEGRTDIEIHEANVVSQLRGCIGVGLKSLSMLMHSKEKLAILVSLLGNDTGSLVITRI